MRTFFVVLCFLFSGFAFGQSTTVVPNSVSPFGVAQTGNFLSGACDGSNPDYFKVTVLPGCYGANLRSGGSTLDPNGAPITMKLKLNNGGSEYATDIEFPVQVTWPENHGTTCQHSGNNVACTSQGKTINYTCKPYDAGNWGWFLDQGLDCNRNGDPLAENKLNKNIKCRFFYTWEGTGKAAVNSYHRIPGIANCGFVNKNLLNMSDKVKVGGQLASSNPQGYATKGKVVVASKTAKVPHRQVIKDMRTHEVIPKGQPSFVTAEFYQGGKLLTYKLEKTYDIYEQCLTVKPSFLGANQFCGSYYSPIMLFFNENLPRFVGQSSFPLYPDVTIIQWPEPKHQGYFLAYDGNGDGKIVSGDQLFGEGNGFTNGFEKLKLYDSNKDGVIDNNDKDYGKFLLWNDANGNGLSEKGEVKKLADLGVKSIGLKYNLENRKSFGPRAEAREQADFTFVKDGKDVKGIVYDIWLAPVEVKRK